MAHFHKLVVALLASVAAAGASANVTYTLTGSGVTGCGSRAACAGDQLLDPAISTNLVMNLTFSDVGALTGWSYNGAFVNLSSSAIPPGMTNYADVHFQTNSSGVPTYWGIAVVSSSPSFSSGAPGSSFGSGWASPGPSEFAVSYSATGVYGVDSRAKSSSWLWSSNGSPVPNLNIAQTYTVAAVPEPETYGMMMAGLGIVGLAARRRKQSA